MIDWTRPAAPVFTDRGGGPESRSGTGEIATGGKGWKARSAQTQPERLQARAGIAGIATEERRPAGEIGEAVGARLRAPRLRLLALVVAPRECEHEGAEHESGAHHLQKHLDLTTKESTSQHGGVIEQGRCRIRNVTKSQG